MTAPTQSVLARPVPAEVAARREAPGAPVIVDVRTPAEFEGAHIAGSFNLPLEELRARADQLADAGPLVLVCRMGQRSREAETLMRAAGHDSAVSMEGGLEGWERAGLPLQRGQQRWSMERQVRGVAGSVVLAGSLGGLLVSRKLGVLAAFIGGGLLFSAITDFCGMAKLLALLPYNQDPHADYAATVERILRH